jgi:acetyl-CoA carboxylase biotin carboxyl carrier protein
MAEHQIGEFEWENSGEKIRLKTMGAMTAAPMVHTVSHPVHHAPAHSNGNGSNGHSHHIEIPAAAKPATAAVSGNQKQVLSPFVGTFYRSPSPEAESYVKEGQSVKKGDTLCIVEAMKLMNEIESDFNGKIVSILAENGQPVEFGEPLFVIEPN